MLLVYSLVRVYYILIFEGKLLKIFIFGMRKYNIHVTIKLSIKKQCKYLNGRYVQLWFIRNHKKVLILNFIRSKYEYVKTHFFSSHCCFHCSNKRWWYILLNRLGYNNHEYIFLIFLRKKLCSLTFFFQTGSFYFFFICIFSILWVVLCSIFQNVHFDLDVERKLKYILKIKLFR